MLSFYWLKVVVSSRKNKQLGYQGPYPLLTIGDHHTEILNPLRPSFGVDLIVVCTLMRLPPASRTQVVRSQCTIWSPSGQAASRANLKYPQLAS
jgi:hypothetical protein